MSNFERKANGRPPLNGEKMITDAFAVPEGTRDLLSALARHMGKSKAHLIREGIDLVLDRYKDEVSELITAN